MNMLYLITKTITYPGAYLKGVWEHMTCRTLRIPVRSRSYLRANEWCGHAEHEPAMTPVKAFLLCFLPFLAQCVFGAVFLGASVGPLLVFGVRGGEVAWLVFFFAAVCLFLGVSVACNAFPQWSDAKRLWHLFYGKPTEEELALLEADIAQTVAAIEEIEEAEEDDEDEEEEAFDEGEEIEEFGDLWTQEDVDTAAQPTAPPQTAPKFAGLFGKILFAPCNAFFYAGAALERWGVTAILAVGITVLLLILNYV